MEPSSALSGPPFVGSIAEEDGSVTIMLRGCFDGAGIGRVGEHVDIALARGARIVTLRVIGPLHAGAGLCELLGRTQTRLTARQGLLTVRGLRPEMLDEH